MTAARYPWSELAGAPHNIIRHPMMPGVAFLTMWTTLESGQPFFAYVHNLASGGVTYTVLATIVPLGDGYLSVRIAPQCPELLAAADSVYQAARDAEWVAGEQGCAAPERARRGVPALLGALDQAGVPDYPTFMRKALITEVAERRRRRRRSRALIEDPTLARLADLVGQVGDLVDTWSATFEGLSDLSERAGSAARRLAQAMAESRGTASAVVGAQETAGASLRPLVTTLTLWMHMDSEIGGLVDAVVEDLDAVEEARARLGGVRASCDSATGRVDELASLLTMPADLLASWGRMAAEREVTGDVADLVPVVSAQVEATRATATELDEVVAAMRSTSGGVGAPAEADPGVFEEIRHLASVVAGS